MMVKTAEKHDDHKIFSKKVAKGKVTMWCQCGWPGPKYPIDEKFKDAIGSRHLVMVEQESYE